MGTIYYLIPDLYKKKFKVKGFIKSILTRSVNSYLQNNVFKKHKPVGGVKVMYQHCIMLKEMGYDAYPLVMGDYIGNFFGYNLDIRYINDVGYALSANDIIVASEFLPYMGLEFSGCTKVLFNQSQSWRYYDEKLRKEDKGKSYIDLGYDYVINCSDFLSRMLNNKMNIDSTVITNGVDQMRFFPDPSIRVPNRVLALSRKHPEHIDAIKQATKDLNYEFRIVDGLTESELIEEYQRADIFLATGYPEGFSLPPLEAMSCGCAVVGFSGGGGEEYMVNNDTALVSTDGDCIDAANQLERLLADKELKERIREAGLAKSKQYSLENTKVMLDDFFSTLSYK